MRTLLTILGLGGVAFLIWKETQKTKATDRAVSRMKPVKLLPTARPVVKPGEKLIAGVPGKFAYPTRGAGRPAGALIRPMRPTAKPIRVGRPVRPTAKPIRVRRPVRPAAKPVSPLVQLTPLLSECGECDACPPNMKRHIRECPVREQDASFYRNLIEPTYGFPV